MRALVITNMYPSAAAPALGRFVQDQVQALQRLPGIDLELYAFEPGSMAAYGRAAADAHRRLRGTRFDVVHAHYGLTAWPALAVRGTTHAVTLHGTDLAHPRSRALTLAALPWVDLVAAASAALAGRIPGWALRGRTPAVLPCGVDTIRFRPIDRAQARRELGLDPGGTYLLFPADPARTEKRYDRALAVAGEVPLLVLRGVDPELAPLYVNAANAVLVTSEREGFGLAALEALACEVPVLATPCGVAPEALADVPGAYCGPFEPERWRAALAEHLAAGDPRIPGRAVAERYSADAMAARVADAWRALLSR
ncbi:MAG: glycosyltransferase family 4 protein [Solirubrobacteraceae bacterium]